VLNQYKKGEVVWRGGTGISNAELLGICMQRCLAKTIMQKNLLSL
jgi:hypothetical protein